MADGVTQHILHLKFLDIPKTVIIVNSKGCYLYCSWESFDNLFHNNKPNSIFISYRQVLFFLLPKSWNIHLDPKATSI